MFHDKRFRVQWLNTHQANHQADIPEYSILEYFVHFRLFTRLDIHQANHQADIVAKNVKSSMKTDTVDIFITGPFRNAKVGKSTWIAVFGDYGSAWTLTSQFIKGYIGLCYKNYKKIVTLPKWDIEQERY